MKATHSIMGRALFYIVVQDRYQDFYRAQTELGKQAVKASIYEIQRYISAQRHLADLYAKVENHQIAKLTENINDKKQYDLLFSDLHLYIPEAGNYTIANTQGEPLLPDVGRKLGKGCLKDIKNYARGEKINKVFVHSNPMPTDYHFDVLTDVGESADFQGIFFISIHTSVLSKFMKNFELPGHQLILTRPKKGKTMIELTSKGPRPALVRDINLSKNEVREILYSEKIAGTYWTLNDIPRPDYLDNQFRQLVMPIVWSWLFFMVLSMLLLRKISVEQNKKRYLANELQKGNENLQKKVEQRTVALQQSESGFREVLDNSRDVLYKLNLITGKYEYMSPAVNQIIGIKAEAFVNDGIELFFSLLHPDDRHKVQTDCFEQLNSSVSSAFEDTQVYRIRNQKQEYRWLSDNRFIVMNEDHVAQYVIGSVRDITDSKKQEEQLIRSQKMDALGKLTGGIAHDFNNILSIILGSLDLLSNQVGDDEKIMSRIYTIQKASQRAASLTKKMLTFSRYQPDRLSVCNINKIIENMDELLVRAVTPQVEIQYKLCDELWSVNISTGDLEDMLINLSINARDAMSGKGNLTIETNNATLDAQYCMLNPDAELGEYIEIVVSDNGSGIEKNQIEHIFEPFYTSKEQGQGTGLGLSTVYGFIEHSGGHIKVYSELGIGTTFRLYLPRSIEIEDEVQLESHPVSLKPGTETILIVDDENDLLLIASESLKAQGYCVLTANNGPEALEVLQKNLDVSLLFSDVVMPGGMNGYELAEKAVELKAGLLVLLTSGYSSKAIARNGQARFDMNLLSKPYTQANMVQLIRKMLDESLLYPIDP